MKKNIVIKENVRIWKKTQIKKIKLKKKDLQDNITTPLIVYEVLGGMLILFLLIQIFKGGDGNSWAENLFYSLLGSFVVALCCDLGNTRLQKKKDRLFYEKMLSRVGESLGTLLHNILFLDTRLRKEYEIKNQLFMFEDLEVYFKEKLEQMYIDSSFTTSDNDIKNLVNELVPVIENTNHIYYLFRDITDNSYITDSVVKQLEGIFESSRKLKDDLENGFKIREEGKNPNRSFLGACYDLQIMKENVNKLFPNLQELPFLDN